jgi:hypothetical protein
MAQKDTSASLAVLATNALSETLGSVRQRHNNHLQHQALPRLIKKILRAFRFLASTCQAAYPEGVQDVITAARQYHCPGP